MGEALNAFVEEAQGLSAHFDPQTVFSIGGWDITQYVIWLFIALAITFIVVLVAAKASAHPQEQVLEHGRIRLRLR